MYQFFFNFLVGCCDF